LQEKRGEVAMGDIKFEIDGQTVEVERGTTVLRAARSIGIKIPTLCHDDKLEPYGGCRMCMVEIDGIPGYPTACTTTALNGMVVHTNSQAVQEMRREVLQLMLSEHPASCLVCGEAEECSAFQGTIRKVGVTTGCRFCPNDGNCELQSVVKQVGLKELSLPISYKGYPVEKAEEFYDRDYNLCIQCARCVRICQEYRKTSALSFRQRGRLTTIGPAFNMTHREAGCEFCGACISVCPTGALSEKGRKWSGAPEYLSPSVCPLCSLHCDIQAGVKNDLIIGTLPPGEPGEAAGDLCVKGRFCLSELSNHPDRILAPSFRSREGVEELEWSKAYAIAAEKLGETPGDKIAVFVSPDLLLEDLVAVRKLTQTLKTENVTSSVMGSNTSGLPSLRFPSAGDSVPDSSDCIISFFFNGNYGYAPITLGIKRAVEHGAKYYQIGWLTDTTSRFASRRFSPRPDEAASFLSSLIKAVTKPAEAPAEIRELGEVLRAAAQPLLVLGMSIADLPGGDEILDCVDRLTQLMRASVVAPDQYGNLRGLLDTINLKPNEQLRELITAGKIDLLYFIGDCPFVERPQASTIIYQNTFPPPQGLSPDLVLPAAFWGEVSGSFLGRKGECKTVQAAVRAPGVALQDNQIISQILETLGRTAVNEVAEQTTLWTSDLAPLSASSNPGQGYTVVRETYPHRFRGVTLAALITGMAEIAPEDTVFIHPQTAQELGIVQGGPISLQIGKGLKSYSVFLDRKVVPGTLYLMTS
jgi:NADH dehydrogenase/NADH:ubiquinone oxidoreductase subunit G